MNSKVLVTGSMGFIGSHLMEALGDRGVDYDIKMSPGIDVNNPDLLKAFILDYKPKTIVHLAAISSRELCDKDPEQALRTNIIGTFNVLRIAEKYKVKVIIASSAATDEPELSLYGTSKDCMERIAAMFPINMVTTLRFFNVYGPRSKSVVNKFIRQITKGETVKLNGNTTRDYIHVDDIVKTILLLIDTPEAGIFDVGTGRKTKLKDLVKMIEKEVGKKAKVVEGKPIHEIQQSYMKDPRGFYSEISLKEGIRRLING